VVPPQGRGRGILCVECELEAVHHGVEGAQQCLVLAHLELEVPRERGGRGGFPIRWARHGPHQPVELRQPAEVRHRGGVHGRLEEERHVRGLEAQVRRLERRRRRERRRHGRLLSEHHSEAANNGRREINLLARRFAKKKLLARR
jgi:hypothetical protein